jgi:hypothetical protein
MVGELVEQDLLGELVVVAFDDADGDRERPALGRVVEAGDAGAAIGHGVRDRPHVAQHEDPHLRHTALLRPGNEAKHEEIFLQLRDRGAQILLAALRIDDEVLRARFAPIGARGGRQQQERRQH